MGTRIDADELVTASEVAELLGLAQHNSVSTYLHRYDDFPQPVVDKSGGRVRLWRRRDVQRCGRSRPGRGGQ